MTCQRGVALLEVLITSLLFGVVLLGIAGLQISQLRHIRLADQHSRAALAVAALAARVQANPIALRDGDYRLACTALPPPASDCRDAHCTAAQLAAWDLAGAISALRADRDDGAALDIAGVEPLPLAHWSLQCDGDCALGTLTLRLCWASAEIDGSGCQPGPGRICTEARL